MAKKQIDAKTANVISAQPRLHQRAGFLDAAARPGVRWK